MKEIIKELAESYGPSGSEEGLRELIRNKIKEFADNIIDDPLGNLIAVRRGKGKKLLVVAHMDEVGLIVTHIDKNGFLRFSTVGGIQPYYLVGQRVRFGNGTIGVIHHEKIKEIKELEISKMYIDIGARSQEEASQKIKLGDVAVYHRPYEEAGSRLIAKSLDDRIGCAILINTLMTQPKELPNEVYFVFSAQEEVGLRGARTAAYYLNPDYCIAVDVTRVGDTPEAPVMEVSLGKGPAIKVKDSSVICHPYVKQVMIEVAQQEHIPYQLEVLEKGSTDAGSVHLTREGIPSGVLSIPCRYIHTPSEMVDYVDVKYGANLLDRLLKVTWL